MKKRTNQNSFRIRISQFLKLFQLLVNLSSLLMSDKKGLRSIRYAKEIEGIKKIIANDIDQAAVEAIKRNLEYNQVDPSIMIPSHADAR